MIEIGKIINTHGLKGEVKIESYLDFNRLASRQTLFIDGKEYTIQSRRFSKGFEYVVFTGLEDINLVLSLKGKIVYTDKSRLKSLAKDEFFVDDLIGMSVINQEGINRGKVIGVREVPQGHLLEIEVDQRKAFVPFRKEFVKDITDVIVIEEIEGLL